MGGRAARVPAAQLAPAASLARRFARAYARAVYLRQPPAIPGEAAAVREQVAAAATRVPPSRRRLWAHAEDVELLLVDRDRVEADVEIADQEGNSFSVGFTVARTSAGWRIVSLSAAE